MHYIAISKMSAKNVCEEGVGLEIYSYHYYVGSYRVTWIGLNTCSHYSSIVMTDGIIIISSPPPPKITTTTTTTTTTESHKVIQFVLLFWQFQIGGGDFTNTTEFMHYQ